MTAQAQTAPLRQAAPLGIWVIYDHPTDYPDSFVARQFFCGPNIVLATDNVVTALDLDALRRALARDGLTPIDRLPGDDPKIVESWL
jgi:hypothetical protein